MGGATVRWDGQWEEQQWGARFSGRSNSEVGNQGTCSSKTAHWDIHTAHPAPCRAKVAPGVTDKSVAVPARASTDPTITSLQSSWMTSLWGQSRVSLRSIYGSLRDGPDDIYLRINSWTSFPHNIWTQGLTSCSYRRHWTLQRRKQNVCIKCVLSL